MDFLRSLPSVCVVGGEYQIVGCVKEFGSVAVEIDGKYYYEDNSGVLPCIKKNYKITVPKSALDNAKKYSIVYKRVVEKKKYFSVVDDTLKVEFDFKPLEKNDDINIYHLADVHKRFSLAKSAVEYFGEDLDLLVINGDIAEVDTEEDFLEVLTFVGELVKGKIPIVFVRGNHDTRGVLAESFTKYFPSNGNKTYFDFDLGSIGGVSLDVGEDKLDSHEVYAGLNVFEDYRKAQTTYLKLKKKTDKKYYFSVCHIPICKTTKTPGDEFDIECETYTTWCAELKRIGVKFMLSGHLHKAFVLGKDDEGKTCSCEFPVIVGSALFRPEEVLWGLAITLSKGNAIVKFTDDKKEVKESYIINLDNGNVTKQ